MTVSAILWAASGVAGLWLGTPPWMRRSAPGQFAVLHVLASIGGPLYFVTGIVCVMCGIGINEKD